MIKCGSDFDTLDETYQAIKNGLKYYMSDGALTKSRHGSLLIPSQGKMDWQISLKISLFDFYRVNCFLSQKIILTKKILFCLQIVSNLKNIYEKIILLYLNIVEFLTLVVSVDLQKKII